MVKKIAIQKEIVVGGTGALAEASGDILLDVEGRSGTGQAIHVSGELKLPLF